MKRTIRRPIPGNLYSYQSAKGILAYLKSYQRSYNIDAFGEDHIENMKQSLDSEYNQSKDRLNSFKWASGIFLSLYSFIISQLINWESDPIIIKYSAIFAWALALVFICNKSRVFSLSKIWLFRELQKVLISLRFRGKLLAGLLFVFFAAVSFTLLYDPNYLNAFYWMEKATTAPTH